MSISTHAAQPHKERLSRCRPARLLWPAASASSSNSTTTASSRSWPERLPSSSWRRQPGQRPAVRLRRLRRVLLRAPARGCVCGFLGDRIGRQKLLVFVIAADQRRHRRRRRAAHLRGHRHRSAGAPWCCSGSLQGFSVGGEAAGAMTFLAEHARKASAASSPPTPRSRPSPLYSPARWSPSPCPRG